MLDCINFLSRKKGRPRPGAKRETGGGFKYSAFPGVFRSAGSGKRGERGDGVEARDAGGVFLDVREGHSTNKSDARKGAALINRLYSSYYSDFGSSYQVRMILSRSVCFVLM